MDSGREPIQFAQVRITCVLLRTMIYIHLQYNKLTSFNNNLRYLFYISGYVVFTLKINLKINQVMSQSQSMSIPRFMSKMIALFVFRYFFLCLLWFLSMRI